MNIDPDKDWGSVQRKPWTCWECGAGMWDDDEACEECGAWDKSKPSCPSD